jgi:hypothetical protein
MQNMIAGGGFILFETLTSGTLTNLRTFNPLSVNDQESNITATTGSTSGEHKPGEI